MPSHSHNLDQILHTLKAKAPAGTPPARLLAVSKTQPTEAIAELARFGQRAFGENYVQEALSKMSALSSLDLDLDLDLDLEWHLIGRLQSNKCREAAEHFDWIHSVDREKLIAPLNHWRPHNRAPLNVLIQVNIDTEDSKSGCTPEMIAPLAQAMIKAPRLRLRGLMTIGEPSHNFEKRRAGFQRMRQLFDQLKNDFPHVDTLSMGMSEDYVLAIEEGATLVRIGSKLFGERPLL